MPRAPSIAASRVTRLVELGAARGLPRATLLASLGDAALPAGTDPSDRVPIARYYDLLAELARRLQDPGFVFDFARTVRVEDYDVMGFVLMTSSSGLEALRRGLEYAALFDDSGRWTTQETTVGVQLRWVRAGALTLGHRLATELVLAEVLRMCRPRGDDASPPLAVSFRHRAPADASGHRRFFGCRVGFGAAHDALTIPRSWLAVAPRGANASLHAFLERQAARLLEGRSGAATVADRVREVLLRDPSPPQEHRVARQLGLAARTLRRQLAAESSSFRAIAEQMRGERAEQLLRETKVSITEIAFLLGFANASAFGRAARRWWGKSPRELRAAPPR
jgi:AraC-like DNA-binding protein